MNENEKTSSCFRVLWFRTQLGACFVLRHNRRTPGCAWMFFRDSVNKNGISKKNGTELQPSGIHYINTILPKNRLMKPCFDTEIWKMHLRFTQLLSFRADFLCLYEFDSCPNRKTTWAARIRPPLALWSDRGRRNGLLSLQRGPRYATFRYPGCELGPVAGGWYWSPYSWRALKGSVCGWGGGGANFENNAT